MRTINRALKSPATYCAILTVVLLAPFLNKAFHIDDPLFLWIGKQVQAHPLDYFGFDVNWSGYTISMAEENKNPPGTGYYIAAAAALFGWSEFGLHLAFLLPATLFALGVYSLAARFCARPAYATLLSILCPVFLVSATNVMTDVLMTTLYIWGVVLWLRACDQDRWRPYFVASVLIVAAALTKYFAISLIPLLAAYSLASKRPPRHWVPSLLTALALYGVYEWHSFTRYGAGSLLAAVLYAAPERAASGKSLMQQTLTALSYSGGCLAPLLFVSPLVLSRGRLTAALVLTTAVFAMLAFVPVSDEMLVNVSTKYYLLSLGQLSLWIVVGLSALALAAIDFAHRRDPLSLLLALWVAGTFVFAAYLNWSITARTILPLVPPTAILAVRQIETGRPWFRQSVWNWRTALPLILATALSLSVARADYLWANSARAAVAGIKNELGSYPKSVYFLGQWGFQYYMQNAGMTPVDLDKANLVTGDIVISPMNNSNVFPLIRDHVSAQTVVDLPVCRWVTPMHRSLGAGFYSDLWGPLPYAFGPVPSERYVTSLIGKPGNPFDLSVLK